MLVQHPITTLDRRGERDCNPEGEQTMETDTEVTEMKLAGKDVKAATINSLKKIKEQHIQRERERNTGDSF